MHDFGPRVSGASRCAGVPLADVYLEFLAGRCRPNTVLAAASDLRVFFSVVGKAPEEVAVADVAMAARSQLPAQQVIIQQGWQAGAPGVAGQPTSPGIQPSPGFQPTGEAQPQPWGQTQPLPPQQQWGQEPGQQQWP